MVQEKQKKCSGQRRTDTHNSHDRTENGGRKHEGRWSGLVGTSGRWDVCLVAERTLSLTVLSWAGSSWVLKSHGFLMGSLMGSHSRSVIGNGER